MNQWKRVLPSGDLSPRQTFDALLDHQRHPVLLPDQKSGLVVRLPFREDNREWLRGENHRKPKWDPKQRHWSVPSTWRGEVIRKCIDRFDGVIVIQVAPKDMEKCASACWNAKSDVTECECSCGGLNHARDGNPGGYYEIGESLAVKWTGGNQLIATLITATGSLEVASVVP